MKLLNSHKLTFYKSTSQYNSFLRRQRNLIAKFDELIRLAIDSNYKPTKLKWVYIEDGTDCKIEIPERVIC